MVPEMCMTRRSIPTLCTIFSITGMAILRWRSQTEEVSHGGCRQSPVFVFGEWTMETTLTMSTSASNRTDHQQTASGSSLHEYAAVQNAQKNSFELRRSNSQVYQSLPSSTSQIRDSRSHKLLGVEVVPQKKSSRNLDYVFGEAVAKNGKILYCKAGIMVPFTFTYGNGYDPHSKIRVLAEFMEKSQVKKPVERCPNHMVKDDSAAKMHFVRCEHGATEYFGFNENYALRIPLCDATGFMFTCFSSCSAGINRRSIQLTFILEGVDGSCIDMFSLPLKVCANPYRDAFKEGPVVQRRGRQAAGKDNIEQRSCQGHSDNNSHLYEIHFWDPVKLKKCLWYLANEEKFDQLICMDVDDNPFRDVCVITRDTSIKAWLNKREIGLISHADKFERESIFTLGDLAGVYDAKTFTRLGFEPSQCAVLNRAFQNWYHEKEQLRRDI